jgi:hypothetical protein
MPVDKRDLKSPARREHTYREVLPMDQSHRRQYAIAVETLRAIRTADRVIVESRDQIDRAEYLLDALEDERASGSFSRRKSKSLSVN